MCIILHIPHSGTEFWTRQQLSGQFLDKAKDLIDWYTDELFSPATEGSTALANSGVAASEAAASGVATSGAATSEAAAAGVATSGAATSEAAAAGGIIPVIFPYCRIACDVQRRIEDPLEAANLGITYDSNILAPQYGFFNCGGASYVLSFKARAEIIYQEYHHRMEDLLLRERCSLLLDCHSFSSRPTPLLADAALAAENDICIGFNEDRTRPSKEIVNLVLDHFDGLGYKVGINEPFSNSKTFNTPASYKSLMIAVNKRLYMDEDTLEKSPSFCTLKRDIASLYDKLLAKKYYI